MIEIWMRYEWDLSEICLRYSWDTAEICLKLTCDLTEICLREMFPILEKFPSLVTDWVTEWVTEWVSDRPGSSDAYASRNRENQKNNWSFGSKFGLGFWQPNSDAPSSLIIICCNVLLTRLLYCKFICNYIYDCELVFFVAIFLRYLAYNARYYSSRNSQYLIHAPA